ncbi:MAG: integrin alpha [Planctomycetota bacterium]
MVFERQFDGLGQPFPSVVAVLTATDTTSTDFRGFGATVENVGDLNNDGVAEIAVGAPESRNLSSPFILAETGAVNVYNGANYSLYRSFSNVTGIGSRFGAAIAGVGDINGDNLGDLAVGAPDAGSGEVLIINGFALFGGLVLNTISGQQTGERFGASIAFSDAIGAQGSASGLLIGAPEHGIDVGAFLIGAGRVAVHDPLSSFEYFSRTGLSGGAFGSATAFADLDGDGVDTAIALANGFEGVTRNELRLLDPITGEQQAEVLIAPVDATSDLCAIRDLDGDGGEEVLVGLPQLRFGRGGVLVQGLELGLPGPPETWIVGSVQESDYRSATAAALVAKDGDVLLVDGFFDPIDYGPLLITKSLTLIGSEAVGDPAFESIEVFDTAQTTLIQLEAEALTLEGLAERSTLGAVDVLDGTARITDCADVALVDCELNSVAPFSGNGVGPTALRIDDSTVQLVSCLVRGADGFLSNSDGSDAVALVGESRLWTSATSLIGGDGGLGQPPVFDPGGNGGDALTVAAGSFADLRGNAFDQIVGGAAGFGFGPPFDGFGVVADGGATVKVSGGLPATTVNGVGDITVGPDTAPFLVYEPFAELGAPTDTRIFADAGELLVWVPSLNPAVVDLATVAGTPVWVDLATIGSPFPLFVATSAGPTQGFLVSYQIPLNPNVVGLQFHLQGLRFNVSTQTYEGTNGGAITIVPL